ncbi:hypothetical protein Bhyg_03227 [Pseudolycoriella hygida]|uniref:Uncharacterized protein n=1 Tax=Pseudolycoriella hygida TaxID=35572 RepID=A0A9Q0NCW5_9DIPT|nr:hypothetical protein Bhyg_03227 [Pseudolycoriella hygida]
MRWIHLLQKRFVFETHGWLLYVYTEQAWKKHKLARNAYTTSLRDKKKMFIEDKLHSAAGNSKATWNILKKLLKGRTSKEVADVNINGVVERDPKSICEEMNNFYVENIDEINRSIGPPKNTINALSIRNTEDCEFYMKCVTRQDIESKLKEMEKKKDVDKISPGTILPITWFFELKETRFSKFEANLDNGDIVTAT